MARKRRNPEDIVTKLRDVLLSSTIFYTSNEAMIAIESK